MIHWTQTLFKSNEVSKSKEVMLSLKFSTRLCFSAALCEKVSRKVAKTQSTQINIR